MIFSAVNPFNNEVLSQHTLLTAEALDKKLHQATIAFERWRFSTVEKRTSCLEKLASALRRHQDQLAKNVTLEMGKLLWEAQAEIEKCAQLCEYYAKHLEKFLQPTCLPSSAAKSIVLYQPLGVILGIMPWNFPYWQVFRFAIPALMMGNVVLVKHALNVPQCALDMEKLFVEAGFMEESYQNLFIDNDHTTQLIEDPRIQGVSLTGSDRAGKSVAARAGQYLKKTVLELGGSDPFIVLDEVDIAETVTQAMRGRFQNCGQSCIAAKRFIVMSSVAQDFIHAFQTQIETLQPGNPLLKETTLAPMARSDLRVHLAEQVNASLQAGAKCLTGGRALDLPGVFFAPTLLTDIPIAAPAAQEELFGPVASIFVVHNIEEAIKVANATPYGLGASIWCRDVEKGQSIAEQIQAGMVFVNHIVQSQPALPFGGIKQSGYGRELAVQGLHEFANCKTLYFA